ncbi:MAG: hypothetical protein J6K52_07270 [Clostridia bacterium]|nr:hypothetical protein [Clostridia bacterium]MBQ7788251.1 hypothetical protein [Clostridia bacterium]
MSSEVQEERHDVVIKSREHMEMSGIIDVSSFDDAEIIAQTSLSSVSIEGENLKIERFNAQSGELIVNGHINGMFYYKKEPQKKKKFSFFK